MAEPIILDEFCPYCRRPFRLTSDGALRKHRAVPGDVDHCAGSGYRPFKTRSKADCPHCHPENFPRREETIMTRSREELLKLFKNPGTYKITEDELEILDPSYPLRHVRPSTFRVHVKKGRSAEFELQTRYYQDLSSADHE